MALRSFSKSSAAAVLFYALNLGQSSGALATLRAHMVPPRAAEAGQASSGTDLARQEADLREAVERSPRNAAYLARLGSVLAMENKLDEAISYFEKALKLNPADVETRRSLGTTYWQLGQLENAQKNLETVLRARPDDTLATLFLGMVAEDEGNHSRAAKLLGDVLPLVRQRPEMTAALVRAYYHLGDVERARKTLQILTGSEAVFQAGRLAAEFKDYETAEKMFLSIQTTYPDPGVVNYNLALAQFSAKHYERCEKTLQSSIDYGHGTPEAYALLGWTLEKQDRLPEMMKAFEKAINLQPGSATYFLDLGEALIEKKSYATAVEVANEAIKRFPASSRAFSLKGSAELKMYLLTEALKSYTKALGLDSNDPKAALGLALTQWNMDHTENATKSFEEGARKFPNDAFFQLKYALFLLNAPGERDAAQNERIKALLKKSVALDDSDAEAHFQLGNLAMKANNYEEAIKELQTAAKLDPELSKAHVVLARVYRRAGRPEDAERETELYQKLKASEDQNAGVNAAIGTRHP
jgi:tetratricopeptide (TPR) repeat protein